MDVITQTQYIEGFIPQELFILVFIAAMVFFIISFLVEKGAVGIVFSAVSSIMTLFLGYSTFFLRWNTEYIPIMNTTENVTVVSNILEINQMFLCQPLLFLLIGMFALCVVSLWYNVSRYSKATLEEQTKKLREEEEDEGYEFI